MWLRRRSDSEGPGNLWQFLQGYLIIGYLVFLPEPEPELVNIVGAIGLRTTLGTGVTTCGVLCLQPRQRELKPDIDLYVG
jgi:hypothetical protein